MKTVLCVRLMNWPIDRALRRRDPHNLLYARGPRLRLPAEIIRDNALSISGLFSANMGGPPIYPPQPDGIWRHVGRNEPKYTTSQGDHRFRRGVYVIWRRSDGKTPEPGQWHDPAFRLLAVELRMSAEGPGGADVIFAVFNTGVFLRRPDVPGFCPAIGLVLRI